MGWVLIASTRRIEQRAQFLSRALSAVKGKYLAFALPAYATVGMPNTSRIAADGRGNIDVGKRIFKVIAVRDAEQCKSSAANT